MGERITLFAGGRGCGKTFKARAWLYSKLDFRPIPFAEGYFVSKYGDILGKQGRLLSFNIKNGYAYARMNNKDYRVHRVVAAVFIPNPNNFPIVNHKDHNCLNNRADNLEWCTAQYNARYSAHLIAEGLRGKPKSKESRSKISLTQQKRFKNRELPTNIYIYRKGYRFQVLRQGKLVACKDFEDLDSAIKYKEKWFSRKARYELNRKN